MTMTKYNARPGASPIRAVRLFDEYTARANQHRPTDPKAWAVEIRRLRSTGLTANDISDALRLSVHEVLNAISNSSTTQ